MKAINIKLATFSFAAMLLASCSDSNNIDSPTPKDEIPTTIVGSAVKSITDPSVLAARVTNFKNVNSETSGARLFGLKTRASESEPTIPSDAQDIRTIKEPWNTHRGIYFVEGDYDANSLKLEGMTIYVKGKFIYNSANAYYSDTHIIVMKSGTLVARNDKEPFSINKIDCWGKIVFPTYQNSYIIKNTFNYYGNAENNNENINIAGKTLDIQNDAKVKIEGNVSANKVSCSSNQAEFVCTGDVTTNELYLTNSSKAWINGKLETQNLKMDGSTELHSGCSLDVSNDVYLTNNVNVYTRHFSTPNLKQDSNAKIHLINQGVLDISGTYTNLNNGSGSVDFGEAGVALIKCNKVIYNAPGKIVVESVDNNNWEKSKKSIECKVFTTSGQGAVLIMDVTDGFYSNGDTNTKVTEQNTYIDWSAAGTVVPKDKDEAKNFTIKKSECYPAGYNDNTTDTKPDPDPKPYLEVISSIDYDQHKHNISATCIQPLNGHMYLSYHTRGDGHGACVEVFKPVDANSKVTLEQYLYDEGEDLDFNHLLAVKLKPSNERMVYMPGSSNKKGAMFAYIPVLDEGLLATESKAITTEELDENGKKKVIYQQPLNFIQMNPATGKYKGYDENCVAYNDETNHLIVMTTKGYIIYDADTYNEVDKISKPGKAKHVDISDGKIVTLYLDREPATKADGKPDTEEAIPATIEVFDQNTEDLSNPTAHFSISTIEPNNGKNVIAVDDNKIYVCRGAAGMYVYDMNGNELWHYQMPSPTITNQDSEKYGKYKAYANGCYVGKKYVYIAYGGYGLVILDKETHNVVAHKDVVKSANYVVEYNGYIYVAFGQSRLQVFKLHNAAPEVSYDK